MYISGATCPHSLLLPFPEHGRGREGREGEKEPVHPADASGSHLFQEGSARQAWPHMVESAQNAWGLGKVEVEETGANSQAFFPPPPSRAAGPWPNHTSIFAFIVHAVAGVPSTAPALWWLSSLHICGYHGPPFVILWASDQRMPEPRLTQARLTQSSSYLSSGRKGRKAQADSGSVSGTCSLDVRWWCHSFSSLVPRSVLPAPPPRHFFESHSLHLTIEHHIRM